jgi:membrane carboxypeptidase/penicillin-binding protein
MQTIANRVLRGSLLDYNRRHGYRGVVGNLDLAEIQEDPFEEDLIVDNRVGGLRKGVVITINEAAPIIGETDDEGELRMITRDPSPRRWPTCLPSVT